MTKGKGFVHLRFDREVDMRDARLGNSHASGNRLTHAVERFVGECVPGRG